MPLLQGLIAIFAITGVGKLFLRCAGVRNLPWYWRVALAPLAGQVVVSVVVEATLISGAGSAFVLRLLTWLFVGIAIVGHVFFSCKGAVKSIGELFRADRIISAVLLLAVLTNLVV